MDCLHRLEQHLVAQAILHGSLNGPIGVSMFQRNHVFCVNVHDRSHHLFLDQLLDLHHSFDSYHYHFGSPCNWSTVMIVLLVRSAIVICACFIHHMVGCHSVRVCVPGYEFLELKMRNEIEMFTLKIETKKKKRKRKYNGFF